MTIIHIEDTGDNLGDYMTLEGDVDGFVYIRAFNPLETNGGGFANLIVPIAELRAALDKIEANA